VASTEIAPLEVAPSALKLSVRIIVATIARAIGTLLAAAFILAAGILSSRYMISHGSKLTTDSFGPWQVWRERGRSSADPYTKAHIARSGALFISSDSAGVFEARTDLQGSRLHSSCDYVLEAPATGGQWWSIAVFDDAGMLISNDAGRYAFTSDTAALNPDGSFVVTLGRDARPGNWLPTGGAGRLTLVYTLLDPASGLSNPARDQRAKLLPTIRREGCS
jgi:hypothetical protein